MSQGFTGYKPNRQIVYLAAALAVTIPGVVVRLTADGTSAPASTVMFGLAIVGAAFMLSWAAEVVQLDISAGLALALLALIAVLPEYAVDFVFTWKAGSEPARFAPLALANMTGANQLLIGLGWPLIVLIGTWRLKISKNGDLAEPTVTHEEVHLERKQSVEIAYLTVATIYGLFLPLRHSVTLLDAIFLVGLYVAYLLRIAKAPAESPELIGPAALIGMLGRQRRRIVNALMFVVAAGVILLCAEPFAESLVHLGETAGIDEFLLVKWLAPLASETPEFLVAGLFAWRLAASTGLGALLSSKVNQWTLLVGTLPIVFAIASRSNTGLPLDTQQRVELFVTAAQSVFAVAVLANRSMDRREAWLILGLFGAQFVSSWVLTGQTEVISRLVVGGIYLALAAWVFFHDRHPMERILRDGLTKPYAELAEEAA